MGEVVIRVVREDWARDLPLPSYQTPGASGMDVLAACEEDIVIEPGDRALVPTGLKLEIPDGYEVQVRPRSGLAWKHGVTVLNAPGTIDSDYRGEVKVILVNLGTEPYVVRRGARIAQMVVAKVERARFEERERVSESERGSGGFGHTRI